MGQSKKAGPSQWLKGEHAIGISDRRLKGKPGSYDVTPKKKERWGKGRFRYSVRAYEKYLKPLYERRSALMDSERKWIESLWKRRGGKKRIHVRIDRDEYRTLRELFFGSNLSSSYSVHRGTIRNEPERRRVPIWKLAESRVQSAHAAREEAVQEETGQEAHRLQASPHPRDARVESEEPEAAQLVSAELQAHEGGEGGRP